MNWKRWLISAGSSWLLLSVNVVVAYFATPLLVRTLGQSGFGWWASVASVAALLSLLEGGLGGATTRFLAAAHHDTQLRASIMATVSRWSLRYAGLTVLVTALLVGIGPTLFHRVNAPVGELRGALFFIGVSVAFGTLTAGPIGALQAEGRWVTRNLLQVARQLAWLGCVLLVARFAWGVPEVAATVAFLAAGLFLATFSTVARRWVVSGPRHPPREILAYGGLRAITGTTDQVVYAGPTVLALAILGPAAAAVVGLALRLQEMLRQGVISISQFYLPEAARLAGSRPDELRDNITRGFFLFGWLTTPPVVVLLVSGRVFLTLWIGEELGGEVARYLILAIVPIWIYLLQILGVETFYGIGRPSIRLKLQAASAFITLTLTLLLAKSLGTVGVLASQAAAITVVDGILLPIITYRIFGAPGKDVLASLPAFFFACVLPALIAGEAVRQTATSMCFYLPSATLAVVAGYAFGWVGFLRKRLGAAPWRAASLPEAPHR